MKSKYPIKNVRSPRLGKLLKPESEYLEWEFWDRCIITCKENYYSLFDKNRAESLSPCSNNPLYETFNFSITSIKSDILEGDLKYLKIVSQFTINEKVMYECYGLPNIEVFAGVNNIYVEGGRKFRLILRTQGLGYCEPVIRLKGYSIPYASVNLRDFLPYLEKR